MLPQAAKPTLPYVARYDARDLAARGGERFKLYGVADAGATCCAMGQVVESHHTKLHPVPHLYAASVKHVYQGQQLMYHGPLCD